MYRMYSKPINGARVAVVGECRDGALRLSAAVCSNKDQFMRKKGRAIAEGRLAKGKYASITFMEECDGKTFHNMATKLSETLVETKQVVDETISYSH